jgi:hypothetical protein
MVVTIENIRRWRLQAEELRLLAGTIEDASARLSLLKAANSYETIAANVEAGLKSGNVVALELPTILPA